MNDSVTIDPDDIFDALTAKIGSLEKDLAVSKATVKALMLRVAQLEQDQVGVELQGVPAPEPKVNPGPKVGAKPVRNRRRRDAEVSVLEPKREQAAVMDTRA